VIAEKSRIADKVHENQDVLVSRTLFHQDEFVFVDKYPVSPVKPSKLEVRFWGSYIVTDVLPLNAIKIRYHQG
jgi:hypothetical protein